MVNAKKCIVYTAVTTLFMIGLSYAVYRMIICQNDNSEAEYFAISILATLNNDLFVYNDEPYENTLKEPLESSWSQNGLNEIPVDRGEVFIAAEGHAASVSVDDVFIVMRYKALKGKYPCITKDLADRWIGLSWKGVVQKFEANPIAESPMNFESVEKLIGAVVN